MYCFGLRNVTELAFNDPTSRPCGPFRACELCLFLSLFLCLHVFQPEAVDVLLLLAAGSPCRAKGSWTVAETSAAVAAEEQRWTQLRQRWTEVTALHDVAWDAWDKALMSLMMFG